MYRLSVADVDSPSYFVATAAVELGFFKQERPRRRISVRVRRQNGPERLRDGTLDFFGGPAYAATRAFPAWQGAKLLCALSRNIPTGSWRCAPISTSSAAMSTRSRALTFHRRRPFPKWVFATSWPNRESTSNATMSGSSPPRSRTRTEAQGAETVSTPSSRVLPTPIGVTACASRSARVSASPRPISIFAAATVRRGAPL